MKKTFYCLWKKHGKTVTLNEDVPTYFKKSDAFKMAKKLQKDLIYGGSDSVLVRKITEGSLNCIEWEFEPLC